MLTVRTSENTVITSFRLISERQDFSSVRTGENTVRARARIHVRPAQRLSPDSWVRFYKRDPRGRQDRIFFYLFLSFNSPLFFEDS